MIEEWKKQIGIAYLVKQRVADLDSEGLWPFHMPEVGASDSEIKGVEAALNEPLDDRLRMFLTSANGWKGILHAIDLFGTEDLVGGLRHDKAEELLDSLEPLKPLCGVERQHCLPIGVSSDGIDLFFISRRTSPNPGVVYWIAGQLIEQYPNFDEFFLAMMDYNRAESESLQKSNQLSTEVSDQRNNL